VGEIAESDAHPKTVLRVDDRPSGLKAGLTLVKPHMQLRANREGIRRIHKTAAWTQVSSSRRKTRTRRNFHDIRRRRKTMAIPAAALWVRNGGPNGAFRRGRV
jgi:hypothetical protein